MAARMSLDITIIAQKALAASLDWQALPPDDPDGFSKAISQCATLVADLNSYGEAVKHPVDACTRELYLATGMLLQASERFLRYSQYVFQQDGAARWRRATVLFSHLVAEVGTKLGDG